MTAQFETLASEAMKLPDDERLTLARMVLTSLEPPLTVETQSAWDQEIRRRIARFDSGEVQGIPAGKVFAARLG